MKYHSLIHLLFSSLCRRCASRTGQRWTGRVLRSMGVMQFPLVNLTSRMVIIREYSPSLDHRFAVTINACMCSSTSMFSTSTCTYSMIVLYVDIRPGALLINSV